MLANLIRHCQRVVHDIFNGRLSPTWEIHFLKIRKLFLCNEFRLCRISFWDYLFRFALSFFLIFSYRFISFLFFLQEVLVSIIEIEDLLYPLKALFEMRLIVHKGNDHLILSF